MKNILTKLVLLSCLILFAKSGLSQSGEIEIEFIGNCGLHMTDGILDIYTDFPYKSGAYGYMEYDKAELDSIPDNSLFIFTHRHADHYSKKIVRTFLKTKKGKKYGAWNISELEKLGDTIPGFSIEAIKTDHRFSFKHCSYVIIWHGKRIFLSGDTESAETIGKSGKFDWAFVPYWILLDAKEKNIKIDADRIGVYHLYPNQKITNGSPERIELLDVQGEKISIAY